MSVYQIIINIFSYSVLIVAPFYVWSSRHNVAWSTQFGFYVTAFLLPLLVIDYNNLYTESSISTLTQLNVLGAFSMLFGIVVGTKISKTKLRFSFGLPNIHFVNSTKAENRVVALTLFGCIGMISCFVWMGFLPVFAEDPFLAKFFKGSYKDKYEQVALLYRLSQFSVITTLPLAIAYCFQKKNTITITASIASMIILAGSLTRAPVFEGLLLIAAIAMSRKKLYFYIFLICSTVFYMAGSAIYYMLGLVDSNVDVLRVIAEGAPDINDNLSFLSNFNLDLDITYGATFIGGLVPGNFKYNPAVFSLGAINADFDIGNSASGGFRMPSSTWGYVAFGYIGVMLTCSMSGIIFGACKSNLKKIRNETSLVAKVALALWFKIVVGFFSSFYVMFYYGLLSIVVFVAVTRRFGVIKDVARMPPALIEPIGSQYKTSSPLTIKPAILTNGNP